MADGRPFVRVTDTGPGVAPQERERIFVRFYRGERSGKLPGHGLGLSIAESIANLHGFKLTVEDNNPGARFELTTAAPAASDPGTRNCVRIGPLREGGPDRDAPRTARKSP